MTTIIETALYKLRPVKPRSRADLDVSDIVCSILYNQIFNYQLKQIFILFFTSSYICAGTAPRISEAGGGQPPDTLGLASGIQQFKIR